MLADIAVGAPYDGSGQVYLYYGSPNGINTKPAQVRLCVFVNVHKSKTRLKLHLFCFFDFFRYFHQDPNQLHSLDILCLATWTWTTINTQIWLWDLCLILSLFTSNFTTSAFSIKEFFSFLSFLFIAQQVYGPCGYKDLN